MPSSFANSVALIGAIRALVLASTMYSEKGNPPMSKEHGLPINVVLASEMYPDFKADCPTKRMVGQSALKSGYISDARTTLIGKPCSFDIGGGSFSLKIDEYKNKTMISPLKATE